jgi:general secretion pathway protein J
MMKRQNNFASVLRAVWTGRNECGNRGRRVTRTVPCATPRCDLFGSRRSDFFRIPDFGFRISVRGFTLLEVLIAVAIFSIVLVAINTVFYSAMRLRTKTIEGIEMTVPMERAIAIIKRDLESIVPPGVLAGNLSSPALSIERGMDPLGSVELFTGSAVINDASPFGDIQKVTYYLKMPEDALNSAGKDLFRGVTRNLLATIQDEPEEQWLMENVENLEFAFYTGTEWREVWDANAQETALPRAIRVQIDLAREDDAKRMRVPVQLFVPVMTQARTNVSQSTESDR